MDITLYQIDLNRDVRRVAFAALDDLEARQGTPEVDAGIYEKVFEGTLGAENLERVFETFNLDPPEGCDGRSMSVSDVVAVHGPDGNSTEYFYCDPVGFRKVDFDESLAAEHTDGRIRVVVCEPGKTARIAEIGTGLEDLQRAVGGLIETFYPFEEEVCIVCNDEGKINGMKPCRAIYDEERNIRDIVFGPFFICGCAGPEFSSLTDEQLGRYSRTFRCPENYYRDNGTIRAVPYSPAADLGDAR